MADYVQSLIQFVRRRAGLKNPHPTQNRVERRSEIMREHAPGLRAELRQLHREGDMRCDE